MYTTWDIYCIFRKVQSKGVYRLPKDWNKHFNNKFGDKQKDCLQKITDYFNTKGQNINPDRYFEVGFQIFKNFNYNQFFDKKIIEMYKRFDKLEKRNIEVNKKNIIENVKYVLTQVEECDKLKIGGPLKYYCRIRDSNYISKPINDYINNYISTVFLTGIIYERMFTLNDIEISIIPYVIENYRDVVAQLRDMEDFLFKLKYKIGS